MALCFQNEITTVLVPMEIIYLHVGNFQIGLTIEYNSLN